MAFTVKEIQPGGHSGEISIGQSGKAVEIWSVVADRIDYSTEDLRISGLFPAVYESFHPKNGRLRFMPVQIEQNEEAPQYFKCTLTWSSDPLDPKEKTEDEDNPLNRRARVSVKTQFLKETRLLDFYGEPKVNAAKQLFDPPPENNTTVLVITIKKNVTVFPDWVFNFADAINSVPFTIKGRTFAKRTAWLANVELGDEITDGPFPYCESVLEMWIKKKRKPLSSRENPKDVPDPWLTEVLNEGYHELIDGKLVRIKVVNPDTGVPENVASPHPLTTDGRKLDPINLSFSGINYKTFRDHDEMDFNAISYLWSDA